MANRYQPPSLPDWRPLTPPANPKPVAGIALGKLAREAVFWAGLSMVAVWRGVPVVFPWFPITIVTARALLWLIPNIRAERRLGRTLLEWALVGLLVFLATGGIPSIPGIEATTAPKLEANQVTDDGKLADLLKQWKAEWDKTKKEAAK